MHLLTTLRCVFSRADHLKVEGLFRLSGSQAEINAWKLAFDTSKVRSTCFLLFCGICVFVFCHWHICQTLHNCTYLLRCAFLSLIPSFRSLLSTCVKSFLLLLTYLFVSSSSLIKGSAFWRAHKPELGGGPAEAVSAVAARAALSLSALWPVRGNRQHRYGVCDELVDY